MASDGNQHRSGPRAPIELKVEYKQLNTFFADYTKNICKGGTFIRTKKPLAIGTEFVFKLQVPQLEAPLELHGRVQWTVKPEQADSEHEPGMGNHGRRIEGVSWHKTGRYPVQLALRIWRPDLGTQQA